MEIKVYLSFSAYQNHKSCYCRHIETEPGLEIDFGLLLRSMRILYGCSCIVEFLIVS